MIPAISAALTRVAPSVPRGLRAVVECAVDTCDDWQPCEACEEVNVCGIHEPDARWCHCVHRALCIDCGASFNCRECL